MPPAARGAKAKAQGRSGARPQPLEHRILLTATLCLLAFGAVMVYSASSASTVLQGEGNGSAYLVKFVIFGGVGLALMHYLARNGVAKVQGVVGPLLAVSFVLVLAVHIPHVGVSVNGARRWIGPGIFQFEPSELLKLALALYAATLLARRPQHVHDLRALSRPLLVVVGGACLLVVTQPDLGTALVIAFTTSALLLAAGIPLAQPRDPRRLRVGGGCAVRARTAVRACPADLVPRPLGARLRQRLPDRPGPDRDRLGRPLRGGPGPVGAEDLLHPRGADRLHPRGDRRRARASWACTRCSSSTR